MKRIILFSNEELDSMIHGYEIAHHVDGQILYFMSKERFAQLAGESEVYGPDEEEPTMDIFERILSIMKKWRKLFAYAVN